MADIISDAVLDLILDEEPDAKVACETLLADDLIVIAGEFHTRGLSLRQLEERIPPRVRDITGYTEASVHQIFDNSSLMDGHRGPLKSTACVSLFGQMRARCSCRRLNLGGATYCIYGLKSDKNPHPRL